MRYPKIIVVKCQNCKENDVAIDAGTPMFGIICHNCLENNKPICMPKDDDEVIENE